MFSLWNRQQKRTRRPIRQPLTLEALEERTLLSSTPTTVLDLNGLSVDPGKYSSTDILVQFQGTPGTPAGPGVAAGTTLGRQLPLETGFYKVNLDKDMTVAKALSEYKAEKGVLDAEPDYELTVSSVPNDPLLSRQWGLNNIDAKQAWNVANGSPNIVVAVMDTGVAYDSPDLYDNIWINQSEIPNYWYTKSSPTSGYDKIVYKWQIKTATPGIITFRDLNNPVNKGLVWDNNGDGRIDAGDLLRSTTQGGWMKPGNTKDGDRAHPNDLFGWNFVNNSNNPLDNNGHGTNVAGILGAAGNNGRGVAGVDWNVRIMPVKFIGANGEGSISDFIQGLNYAVEHGAKITNNSWEGAPYSQALYDAFLNAERHGVICVAAAGNEGSNNDRTSDYPASFSQDLNNVVAVAATDNRDRLASFSNYGAHSVALAAPGVNILSTLPNGRYGDMSGTSMAAPEVSGAMALVWGLHPSWSYTRVIDQVLDTTDKLPSLRGKVETGGQLDLAAAVGTASTTRATPANIRVNTHARSSAAVAPKPSIRTRPAVTNITVQGPTSNSMNRIVLTFDKPIDIRSFTSSAVTLTTPNGRRVPVAVHVVPNSGDRQIALTFSNQTAVGAYHLSIASRVRDTMGTALVPYRTTITLQAARTYTNSTAETIKPWRLTMSSLKMPDAVVGNVEVRLNVAFPQDRDLYIYLISPTGKTIALDYNRGGWSANLSNTVFSQQAGTPIADAQAPFSGTYRPDSSLNQLTGSKAGGTWRLAIRNSGNHSGTLRNWSLTVTPPVSVSSAPPPKSTTTTTAARWYTNNTTESIKPKSLTVSSVSVPGETTVGNVEVHVDVNYPEDRDLYIYLISPTGKTIALDYNRGGWRANLNTMFSEQARTSIADGKAPFSGDYRPDSPLNQLIGSKAGGTWRLAIRNYGNHTGALTHWSLILTPAGSTSSVQASSVDTSVSAAATPALSSAVSSPATGRTAAPRLSSVTGDTNVSSSLAAPTPNRNNNVPTQVAKTDKIVSSSRTLSQLMASLMGGKRLRQKPVGASKG